MDRTRIMVIRLAKAADLPRIGEILRASPEAAQWEPAGYLAYVCWVAVVESVVQGFIAARQIVVDEFEILNVAVALEARNQGIGSALVAHACAELSGTGYLEVRTSNIAAQRLYLRCGWKVAGTRREYYNNPAEDAVVMKI
jgi:ribosomal-protein-alanine N-acetyltransferase